MTVPVQRGGSQDDPTVTGLILDRLNDLAAGFQRLEDRITQRVEGLTEQFVPRGEYEARHSDVRNQITRLDGRVDSEVTKLDGRINAEAKERKTLEEKLIQGRRWAIGTALTALGLVITVLVPLILANLRWTEPTPNPIPPDTAALDQAVIDAGRELADAQLADPRDPERIAAARQALLDARAARGWPYA